MQSYLKCSETNKHIKRRVMGYRLRMLEFGENFRGQRVSVPCPLGCPESRDFQSHLYECLSIKVPNQESVQHTNFLEEDIERLKINMLDKMLAVRRRKLEEKCPDYTPYR